MPEMSAGLAQALADDWADDMARFPLWAVKEACDDYRRNEPIRTPKPANIIALCLDELGGYTAINVEMREIELALSTKASTAPPPTATPEQISAILERSGHYEMMDEMRARKPQPSEG